MDARALQRFLFLESQDDANLDEALANLFEDLADVTALDVNTKPLEQALSELGIDADVYTIPSGSRTAIEFAEADDFHRALQLISDLSNVSKLADAGWVALPVGDKATATESPCLAIYFTEVKAPEDDVDATAVPDLNTLLKQAREDATADSDMYDKDGERK